MEGVLQEWVELKKKAVETQDFSFYEWFLKELRSQVSKKYSQIKNEKLRELYERIIVLASCELRQIVIKYNKS